LRLSILTISAAALGIAAGAASAAEIRRAPQPGMRCTHQLSGPIAPGDASALEAALNAWDGGGGDQYQSFRLCLDSPGGSLLEALKIAGLGGDFGTAVGPEASCLSACGIIFMAGQRYLEGGVGQVPDRFLHAAGDLGFHAPSLVVTEGSYNEAAVKKAYNVAVQGIAKLTESTDQLQMSLANLSVMLSTPPEEFYRIDTAAKAARWNITAVGVPEPQEIRPLHMTNACINITGRSPHEGNAWAKVSSSGSTVTGTASFGYWDSEPERCDISFRPGHDRFDIVDYDQTGYGLPLVPAMFYPPGTPLRLLAAAPETLPLAPDPLVERYEARCLVFSGNKLTDKEPCRQTDTGSVTDQGRNHAASQFTWPSGAVTVLETVSTDAPADSGEPCCGRGYLLNGKPAEPLYDFAAYDGYGSCYRSSATGNVFCAETSY
jgi:hypothetical protein